MNEFKYRKYQRSVYLLNLKAFKYLVSKEILEIVGYMEIPTPIRRIKFNYNWKDVE